MKKSSIKTIHLFITALIIISAFVGCNRTKADSNIVYTNLVSQHAQNKLSEIMTYAGISDNRRNILIEHIKQFNSYVNQNSLAAEFEEYSPGKTKYDPYDLQDE